MTLETKSILLRYARLMQGSGIDLIERIEVLEQICGDLECKPTDPAMKDAIYCIAAFQPQRSMQSVYA